MARIDLSIPAARVSQQIWAVFLTLWLGNTLALFLVHQAGIEDAWGLVTLLHFDREQNLPTLFSVLLLLGASALAFMQADDGPLPRQVRQGWHIVAAVLALMAIDEFASIHERVDAALRYYLGSDRLPYAAWPIPYALGIIALGSWLWPWFFQLNRRLAVRLVVAGSIYVCGAAGVEYVAGEYLAHIDPNHLGVTDRTRDLFATLEETLEMFALVLLVRTLAREVSKQQNTGLTEA